MQPRILLLLTVFSISLTCYANLKDFAKSTPSEAFVRKLFMLSETLVIILGVVLIVEGIPWFMSPRGTKRMLSELFQMNDRTLRSIGLGFMLAGLILVYLAKTQ